MSARPEFLGAALACGAVLTGKPDGSEAITVVFTIEAWRAFDKATSPAGRAAEIEHQFGVPRLELVSAKIKNLAPGWGVL